MRLEGKILILQNESERGFFNMEQSNTPGQMCCVFLSMHKTFRGKLLGLNGVTFAEMLFAFYFLAQLRDA